MERHLGELALRNDRLVIVMTHPAHLKLHLVRVMVHFRLYKLRKDTWALVVHIMVGLLDLHSIANNSVRVKTRLLKLRLVVQNVALRSRHERGVLHEGLSVILFEQRAQLVLRMIVLIVALILGVELLLFLRTYHIRDDAIGSLIANTRLLPLLLESDLRRRLLATLLPLAATSSTLSLDGRR